MRLMWQGVKSYFSSHNVFMVHQPTSHAAIFVVNLNCRLAYAVWLLHELYEKFPESVNIYLMYDIACSLVRHSQVNLPVPTG